MPRRNLIWAVAVIAAAGAAAILTRQADSPSRPHDANQSAALAPAERAFRIIAHSYYRPVREADVLCGTVRGMVESLDEFSSYVAPGRLGAFNRRLDGLDFGAGLVVAQDGPDVRIVGALAGSPASRLDPHAGWRVLRVGAEDAYPLSAERVADLLDDGEEPVTLRVESPDGRIDDLVVPRQRYAVESVIGLCRTSQGAWSFLLDEGDRVGYVRVTEFVPSTPEQFQRAIRELSGARGLILDLRDNPGGGLESGFAVADLFLHRGAVFTKITRDGQEVHKAHADGTLPYRPMVVLVNGQSASAAELVAGALRLNDRAVLVGTRTRGKGTVQSLIKLPDDLGQINLTTAEFVVGRPPHSIRIARAAGSPGGVQPHVEVPLSADQQRAIRRAWLRAAVLPCRAPTAAATAPLAPLDARALLQLDPQLAAAADLLAEPTKLERILADAAAARSRTATAPVDANTVAPDDD
jgi:carboxyl-terminal processing protease